MTTTSPDEASGSGLPSDFSQFAEFAARHPDIVIQLASELTERTAERERFRESTKYQDLLVALSAKLLQPAKLTVGQLAYWKPGLKNKRRPAYGEPAYVIELYSEPVLNLTAAPGSAYYREPLDLVIGVIDDDEELLLYHTDARRFTSEPPPMNEAQGVTNDQSVP